MSAQPKRIQRSRAKGWRMPEGAVYVGRPTEWGNPFRVVANDGSDAAEFHAITRGQAVAKYRAMLAEQPGAADWISSALRGKDLACWCPLDQPCHADVLLEIANAKAETT